MAPSRHVGGQGGVRTSAAGARRPGWSPGPQLAALVAVVALAGFLVGEQVARSASRPAASARPVPAVLSTGPGGAATTPGGGGAALRQAEADGIDVGRVIDGMRHHVVPAAGRPGTLAVEDDRYRTVFDDRGFQVGEPGADPWFALSLASVSRGGQALRPELGPEHPVAPSVIHRPAEGGPIAVSSDGTNYLVVFVTDGVRAARMDRSGRLLDRTPIAIGPRYGYGSADVAFDGTNHLVVWTTDPNGAGGGDIRGTRVSPAGIALDEGGFLIAGGPGWQNTPAIEFDGTNHLVTWDTDACCGPSPTAATRIDPLGRRVDPEPATLDGPVDGVALSFGGSGHLAVWSQENGVWAARLGLDGALLDPGVFRLSGVTDAPGRAVAFDGENWQVFWGERGPGGSYDIVGTRVGPTGTPADPPTSPIAVTPANETAPRVVRNGDEVVVAWTDDDVDDALAVRVDRSGAVVGPGPIAVATGPGAQHSGPLAEGDGQVLATVQGPEGDACCFTQAVRLSAAGRVLDPAPLLVAYESNAQFTPQIAFDGTTYLVGWNDDRDGQFYRDGIYVARVSRSGVSLDPAGIRVGFRTGERLADVSFDGENFVLAISRPTSPQTGDPDHDLYAMLVSPGGELVTPTAVPVAVGPDNDLGGVLSPDGTDTVVVWNRLGVGVVAARLTRAGTVLDPGGVPISPGEPDVGYAEAAFDGTNHLVVYPRGAVAPYAYGDEIVARRVTPSLQLLDPAALPIAGSPDGVRLPDVAWGGSNFFVVWERQPPGGRRVEGARVSGDGSVLAPGTVPISAADDQHDSPDVAAVGRWFLVTWTRQRGLFSSGDLTVMGARISDSGAVPDPEGGFVIADNALAPDVVAGGDGRWTTAYERLTDPATGVERVHLRTVSPK